MGKKYGLIGVMLLLLISAVAFMFWSQKGELKDSMYLGISGPVADENISLWQNDDGDYYFFIPGWADLDAVRIRLKTDLTVYVDGRPLEDKMDCTGFALDTAYPLEYSCGEMTKKSTITFLQSDNIATMYVDTSSGNME